MHQGKTGDYSEDVKQWTDYYRHFGVSRIHGGLVVLRRKDTPGWVRLERIAQDRGAIGDYVLATFAAEDFVRTHGSAESMLACRFRLTEGLRLIQKSTVSDNRWQPFETMAEFTGGWQAKTELDLIATNILAQFDGIGTVEELNDRFAKSVNAEPSSTIEQFCGLIRHLLRHGVLRVT